MSPISFYLDFERFGQSPALVSDCGAVVSYAALAEQADAFSKRLGSERRLLAVEAANRVDAVVGILGALRHGHSVLLTSDIKSAAGRRLLETYDPDATLSKSESGWELTCRDSVRGDLHPNLAVLLPTSGSTGSAKLVKVSHTALDANARSIAEYLDIQSTERPITSLPIHYSYGLSVLNSHLSVGATILLTERSVVDSEFWHFLDGQSATSLSGVPYTYELLERIGFREQNHPSIATLTQAGGRMPPDNVCRWAEWSEDRNIRFFVMYGQTEASARIAYMPPAELARHPDCIGIPIPGGNLRLVDESGAEIAGSGIPGELVYTGPNVMMGYAYSREELAEGPSLSELHTGDLAERNTSGLYRIVGRKSRFCKLFGLRIALDEVEAILQRHGIPAAATGDDSLIALSVPATASRVAVTIISDELRLPRKAVRTVEADEPPRLSNGKVDYRAILVAAKAQAESEAVSLDPGATSLDGIFERAFPRVSVQPSSTFISLGGDSLNYVNVSMALEDSLGTVPARWETMSIAALSDLAAAASNADAKKFLPLSSEMLLRALAIMGIVVVHASNLVVGGGANVLLLLAGYNLAKYQRPKLLEGRGWMVLSAFLQRIIAPYVMILLAYSLFKQHLDWASLFLISNWFGRYGSFLEPYWFLELLLQCYIIIVATFMLPQARRLGARDPWLSGAVLFLCAVALKVGVQVTWGDRGLAMRTPDALFYLLTLGWCMQTAGTTRRKFVTYSVGVASAACMLAAPHAIWGSLPYPENVGHAAWMFGSVALLALVPTIPVVRPFRALVTAIAAASFYIYLAHMVPVYVILHVRPFDALPEAAQLALALPFALLSGLLLKRLIEGVPSPWGALRHLGGAGAVRPFGKRSLMREAGEAPSNG